MILQEGKYYRARGGQVFGPMVRNPEHDTNFPWCLVFSEPENSWTKSGRWSMTDKLCLFDLVAEVHVSDTPPETEPAPETKTLRDEFAMVALSDFMSQFRENVVSQYAACRLSYDWANAMMEARKK
jgi:hypothetical protein